MQDCVDQLLWGQEQHKLRADTGLTVITDQQQQLISSPQAAPIVRVATTAAMMHMLLKWNISYCLGHLSSWPQLLTGVCLL